MNCSAIFACVLAALLFADHAFAGQNLPRSGRHGRVLVGYIHTSSGWRHHICLEQAHQQSGPGYGVPRLPVRAVPHGGVEGGFYAPYGYCRHGIVYLTQGPPNFPGGVFPIPIPQPPIFPRPRPGPVPPLPPTSIFTNLPPIRVVRPLLPATSVEARLLLMEAQRMRGAGGRPPVAPPLPPTPLSNPSAVSLIDAYRVSDVLPPSAPYHPGSLNSPLQPAR